MTGPTYNELYSEAENLQMLTAARNFQNVATFVAPVAVTLKAPSRIVNAGATADEISYSMDGGVTYAVEWFAAGQEKARRPTHIGGTAKGTGGNITSVVVLES